MENMTTKKKKIDMLKLADDLSKKPIGDNIDDIFNSDEFQRLTDWAIKKEQTDDLQEIDDQISREVFEKKEEKRMQKEIEDFEKEKDIEKFSCFISAMLEYFCWVDGKQMAKDLFDVQIDDWDKDDGDGYHSGNFQMMQKNLYGFLCKCDDKRRRAIAIQSMKYLRGEK